MEIDLKTTILTMNYSSIRNVSEDIAQVLRNNGEKVSISTNPYLNFKADKLIVFMPFHPSSLNPYLYAFREFKGEKYFYTTCDGIPNLNIVNQYLLKDVTFIPNSKFSAQNLQDVGLNVDLPTFHGINFEIVKKAEQLAPQLKEKLNKDFPDVVKFGIVSGLTKRKNMDLMLKVFQEINSKVPDLAKKVHFFVISHKDFKNYEVPENVHFVSEFGLNPREYIFAFYFTMDFVIVPSGTEGFGMPVLESMAMGTPVIHQLMPPLDEFTSWQWNLLIKSSEVEEYYDKDHGQKWKIHKFDIKEMINAIIIASELQDREERSKNLKELSKNYDINNLYRRFLE
jgi:glycosyltransferase involved in cell wall biosynthesis